MLDYESRFRAEVMDSFADAYLRGETPVPCIACNRTVKFRDLLGRARELGAEALATGHYVQRVMGEAGPELHRGADPARDQSYFLFGTTAEQLDFLRFPLGHMPKSETRALAERYELAVADKPDSQDICFVPNGDYASVVQKLRPEAAEPGEIVDRTAASSAATTASCASRWASVAAWRWAAARAPTTSRSMSCGWSPRRAASSSARARRWGRSEIALYDVNWLGPRIDGALPVKVRVRSSQALRPAEIRLAADGAMVRFAEPEVGVSPGQACVVYDAENGSRVLGGGFIRRFAS